MKLLKVLIRTPTIVCCVVCYIEILSRQNMDKSDCDFSTYETKEIISQVRKKEKLVEKLIEEEELYGSKKQKLNKDFVEILTCEVIAR